MSRILERQRLIRAFKDETGESEVDMRKVAEFAVRKGWPLPQPTHPLDLLAKQFADAARQETRRDPKTGNPYRANHAVPHKDATGQTSFIWVDMDDPKTSVTNMRSAILL